MHKKKKEIRCIEPYLGSCSPLSDLRNYGLLVVVLEELAGLVDNELFERLLHLYYLFINQLC